MRQLNRRPYTEIWQQMREFTDQRDGDTRDELWLVEHEPVYTQGQAGKPEHLLNTNNIPLVLSDRGGQITYHGPGQLVAYPLLNIKRLKLGVRDLVSVLENSIVTLLQHFNIESITRRDAPGVYIGDKKIASLGLRVRRGFSFHGIAVNVSMDLTPYGAINPCGYAGLEMTQLAEYVELPPSLVEIGDIYASCLAQQLGVTLVK